MHIKKLNREISKELEPVQGKASYGFQAHKLNIVITECTEGCQEIAEDDHVFITLEDDIYLLPGNFAGDVFSEREYEISFRLNVCGQITMLSAEDLAPARRSILIGGKTVRNAEVIVVPCKGRCVYYGPNPGRISIGLEIKEIDEDVRVVLEDISAVLDKLRPIASGAYPPAGASIGLAETLLDHAAWLVDDDIEVIAGIESETTLEKDNSRILLVNSSGKDKVKLADIMFHASSVGKLDKTASEIEVLLNRIHLSDPESDLEENLAERIIDRTLGAGKLTFNFEASALNSSYALSCPLSRINDTVSIGNARILGARLRNNSTCTPDFKAVPFSISAYLNKAGLNVQHLLKAVGYAAGFSDIEVKAGSSIKFKLDDSANMIVRQSENIGEFVSKMTSSCDSILSFNGLLVLPEKENSCQDLSLGEADILCMSRISENRWKAGVRQTFEYSDGKKAELGFEITVIVN